MRNQRKKTGKDDFKPPFNVPWSWDVLGFDEAKDSFSALCFEQCSSKSIFCHESWGPLLIVLHIEEAPTKRSTSNAIWFNIIFFWDHNFRSKQDIIYIYIYHNISWSHSSPKRVHETWILILSQVGLQWCISMARALAFLHSCASLDLSEAQQSPFNPMFSESADIPKGCPRHVGNAQDYGTMAQTLQKIVIFDCYTVYILSFNTGIHTYGRPKSFPCLSHGCERGLFLDRSADEDRLSIATSSRWICSWPKNWSSRPRLGSPRSSGACNRLKIPLRSIHIFCGSLRDCGEDSSV